MAKRPLPSSMPRTTRSIKSQWGDVTYQAWGLGDQSILLQALTGDDVDESAQVDALNQILKTCVLEYSRGEVEQMPLFLAEFIVMKIRAISIGEVATITKKCSDDCDGIVHFEFNIDNDLKIIRPENHQFTLSIGDYTFELAYPTLYSSIRFDKNEDLGTTSLKTVCKFIKGFYNEEESFEFSDYTEEEQIEFVKTLGADFQAFVQEKFIKTMPYVGITLDAKCPECGKRHTHEIMGASKLFSI